MSKHSGWIWNTTERPESACDQPKRSNVGELIPPDANLVSAYWAENSHDLGLEDLDTPNAWACGGTADQADELLGLVLSHQDCDIEFALVLRGRRRTAPNRGRSLHRVRWAGSPASTSPSHGRHGDRPGRCLRASRVRRRRGRPHIGVLASSTRGLLPKPPPSRCELAGSMPVVLERFERLVP
jgi:hypothetical protein